MAHANRDLPLVPSFAVKLNGRPLLPEMSMWIASVVVEDELDLPGMFTLELISKETEQDSIPWSDEPRLALGATVEVSLGWGDDRESLVVGEIVSLEPIFSGDGPPTLLVRGFDKRYRLNGVRRTRSFVDKTDSSIAELIGSDAGLDIQATDSKVTHPYVMQADQTDLEFLRERARRIQYELAMDGSTMLFRPVANTGSSVVTLTLRDDLFEFRPRMSRVPITGIQVLGWDPKEKQAIRSAAPATDAGDKVETLVRTPFASQAEADQFAGAAFNNASLEFIRGEGRVRGRTDVRAGRVIQLDELGDRFSGAYYVTSVVHRYSPRESYVTEFRARRTQS
jgi:phage protein D